MNVKHYVEMKIDNSIVLEIVCVFLLKGNILYTNFITEVTLFWNLNPLLQYFFCCFSWQGNYFISLIIFPLINKQPIIFDAVMSASSWHQVTSQQSLKTSWQGVDTRNPENTFKKNIKWKYWMPKAQVRFNFEKKWRIYYFTDNCIQSNSCFLSAKQVFLRLF